MLSALCIAYSSVLHEEHTAVAAEPSVQSLE